MCNSEFHIVCVDHKDVGRSNQIKDEWRKTWFDIPAVQRVLRWEEFKDDSLEHCTLVLVHRSALSHDDKELAKQVEVIEEKQKQLGASFSLGIVSAGSSAEHQIWNEGRICVLRTPFEAELSGLAHRIGVLFSEILEAKCNSERLVDAWETFDKADDCCESLMALSLLCQGYLASGALLDDRGSWNATSGIGRALRDMGWAADADDDKLVTSTAVADLKLAKPLALPGVDFWLSPFGEPDGDERSRVVNELRSNLEKEWKGELPECVDRLINDIEQTKDGGSVDMNVVVEAFLAFQERLEKAS